MTSALDLLIRSDRAVTPLKPYVVQSATTLDMLKEEGQLRDSLARR